MPTQREGKSGPARNGNDVAVMGADAAMALVRDGATLAICGAGGGITEPTALIEALSERYRNTGSPSQLTLLHSSGLGDRADRGMSPLALPGMAKLIIGGHWGQSPRLAELAEREEVAAYNFPQGVMSQLFRCAAAGQPGLLTKVGLGTFLDPRQKGGRLNSVTTRELIKVMEIDNEEWLFYPAIRPDVAILRATTADTEGYLSMEDEISYLDVLATAQAAHNNGGIVVVQVKRLVKAGSLPPRSIRVPGYLVDALVVVADQPQLYSGVVDRFLSGDYLKPPELDRTGRLDVRKVIARRAMLEVSPGNVCNVGVGIPDGIGLVAKEEGVSDGFTLTVEHGTCGGTSLQGIYFGASVNMRAMLDMPSQFDFYHGGGLDVAFLSFAEVDQFGNVNVHKFNGKLMGTGGFVDICQNTKKIVFTGTLTAGGLKAVVADGQLQIDTEGRHRKFVEHVSEITFNGQDAVRRGQEVIYVTERAVFRLKAGGIELCEVAPGIDPSSDVFAQMDFAPRYHEQVGLMERRLFVDEKMGIAAQWSA